MMFSEAVPWAERIAVQAFMMEPDVTTSSMRMMESFSLNVALHEIVFRWSSILGRFSA